MSKILLFGEPLIRISPTNYQLIGDKMNTMMYYGGSEINIAKNLQGLHIMTKVFTGLPKNPIGESFCQYLNQYQIDTSNIQWVGNRVGLYYLEEGVGCRQSEVYYDRKNTSIDDIDIDTLDMDALFEGITHFHFSGITIAVSVHVQNVLELLLIEAKKRNIIISIDLNLRTKMISIEDAKNLFSKFARYANICFGIDPIKANEKDITMFDRYNASTDTIEKRMRELKEEYAFDVIFHTIRTTDENARNVYQCYGLSNTFKESISLKTDVLQRIGSGDAFVAGALYKIINQSPLQETIDFAVASGTYKCTVDGDNMNVDALKIDQLLHQKQDINR
ncbi:sugar kinase [Tannockella kyphosi]|uniref:sugar kinase n=1 Tax=Tannockella kyphosi TaxID=2899121 RepID=UPI0020112C2A|nr:sugar kinase [Tannockella kyphosi]